ncbi:MAG: pantoate--beta-alanine ligase [Gracilibacteraceae bacterium]|jgi:pantoate--beta-alanine ligase|nr:pantoate--beta-alanine ligase [Gracilibacteraceae bacterium]
MVITEYEDGVRDNVRKARQAGKKVVLIPTMGALHEGHLSMVRLVAADESERERERTYVVMSVFVNPLQFGPGEDFAAYPRDLRRDAELARQEEVDLLFVPSAQEIYPPGSQTTVQVADLAAGLCGAARPGHFTGVATVVTKLLNIVQPDEAVFGQKDYQQFAVLERMVADLKLPLRLRLAPTVREPSGLALSSRNAYLNWEEKKQAAGIYASLRAAAELIGRGQRDAAAVADFLRGALERETRGRVEYAEVRQKKDLLPVAAISKSVVLLAAVFIGRTRLIDNLIVEV